MVDLCRLYYKVTNNPTISLDLYLRLLPLGTGFVCNSAGVYRIRFAAGVPRNPHLAQDIRQTKAIAVKNSVLIGSLFAPTHAFLITTKQFVSWLRTGSPPAPRTLYCLFSGTHVTWCPGGRVAWTRSSYFKDRFHPC